MIEQGRYQIVHLPREHRLCPLCNSNQVEDEIHFFFQCNKYSVQRKAFINQINRIIPDFDKKSSPESIKLIMNSKEHHVNKLVMKFISSCMKIRDSLLVMQLKFFLFFKFIISAVCLVVIGMLLQYCTMMRSSK